MVHCTLTKEQTMSDVNAQRKPCELTEEYLDVVTGGGARITPNENLSLNFAKLQWAYAPTDPC
jgi:hypothetical protein